MMNLSRFGLAVISTGGSVGVPSGAAVVLELVRMTIYTGRRIDAIKTSGYYVYGLHKCIAIYLTTMQLNQQASFTHAVLSYSINTVHFTH